MTTEAKVTWVEDRRFVGRATSGHAVVVDASVEKEAPSPMEMVLIGTVGCTAYDVLEVLLKKRQQVSGLEVSARAERAETPPRVYTEIDLEYVVHGQAVSQKAVKDAIRLSKETYCSASIMLAQTAKITTSFRIEESDAV
jgi:putative redox protein